MLLEFYQKNLIHHLYKTGAIKFGKFVLKSGRISPYFINMALAMRDGEGCSRLGAIYAHAIWCRLQDKFDYIHGPAYKGIPLASLIAEKLWEQYRVNKRWGYDRKETKNYGDTAEKLIVGDLHEGDRVLIVDDVITTGKTKIDNFKKLFAIRKIQPAGIFVAVDREELPEEDKGALEKAGLKVFSIVKVTEIFEYLACQNLIEEKSLTAFKQYTRKCGKG